MNFITRCAYAQGRVKRLSPSICVSAKTRLFADISPTFVRVLTALSQARRGLTHPVTVMFYTPAGPFSY